MIKIKNKEQLIIPGFEEWRDIFSTRKLKMLEKSWAGVFRKHILPILPVKDILKLYSINQGRPTKEFYSVMGVVILQQFFDLTDKEAVDELAFNQQWHFALECFNETDQVISLRTLWTMRSHMLEHNLVSRIFDLTTDRLIDFFKVDVIKQRLDSVHVYSNMAHLGRIRILVRTIVKFLRNLKRRQLAIFDREISYDMIERYLEKGEESYFSQIKPTDSSHRLEELGSDLYLLKSNFQGDKKVCRMKSFKLLERVFSDHFIVENNHALVKPSKEVSSASVQNPSDPDAGYNSHKGKGYHTQIMETYSTEEEKKKSDKPRLDLITYVETESADKHDSHALEPALKDITERGHKVKTTLADTLYGGEDNVKKSKKYGVTLISPIPGKPSENGMDKFEFDSDSLEIKSCQAGKTPDKIKHNKKNSITTIWYARSCSNCPFLSSCPTKKCKGGRSILYKKEAIVAYFRRVYEESLEFKDAYRYRSGIEATNSRFIHLTSARRSRYRGLPKMKFSQKLKALAINVFRVVRYLSKLAKKGLNFVFSKKNRNIFFMRGSYFEFNAHNVLFLINF